MVFRYSWFTSCVMSPDGYMFHFRWYCSEGETLWTHDLSWPPSQNCPTWGAQRLLVLLNGDHLPLQRSNAQVVPREQNYRVLILSCYSLPNYCWTLANPACTYLGDQHGDSLIPERWCIIFRVATGDWPGDLSAPSCWIWELLNSPTFWSKSSIFSKVSAMWSEQPSLSAGEPQYHHSEAPLSAATPSNKLLL